MNFADIAHAVSSIQNSYTYLKEKGICMATPPLCRECGHRMTLIKDKSRIKDGYTFRCPRNKSVLLSIRVNSILYEKRIDFSSFILMVYFWAVQIPIVQAALMADISENTILSWYQILRCVCARWLDENPIRIGGFNRTVQVDEVPILKKRSNGKLSDTHWIFGGLDTVTRNCFLILISDRSKTNYLQYIEKHVEPGSKILTREDVSFGDIASISVKPGYSHLTMSMDSISDGSSCYFENICIELKNRFIKMSGVRANCMESHLEEYMWRQLKGRTATDAYDSVLKDITLFFPL